MSLFASVCPFRSRLVFLILIFLVLSNRLSCRAIVSGTVHFSLAMSKLLCFLLFVSFGVVWSFLALSRPVLGAIVMSCVVSLFCYVPIFLKSRSFVFRCPVLSRSHVLPFCHMVSCFVSFFLVLFRSLAICLDPFRCVP